MEFIPTSPFQAQWNPTTLSAAIYPAWRLLASLTFLSLKLAPSTSKSPT